ncbi:MAG TPA: FAD-dependent oxidoreductase [Anaerolineales bacterium]|jgi:dimethylamine/trimethylamine dehydrogenase|nr:FAD-dependent oxidoreductase [Anaerolineales bacterium]
MENPYAVLFEPVQIGPVTAPNRFYQVPHCNGFGHLFPRSVAAMRGIKAEGGWGVVCTEETEIHYTSDLSPAVEGRFWDASDIPAFSLTVDAIHEHGALAGIELTHSGHQAGNLYSRATSIDAGSLSVSGYFPAQTRMADKEDLRNIRRWHRQAAIHAKQAGFDIIYCYAAHELSLPMFLLLKRYNQRTDEYGGSLKNRVRFLRELLEDTHEAVGDTCAVALRLAVDELLGEDGLTHDGEGREIVAMLAELPDLWDVNLSNWNNDSGPSRFMKEGYQERYISFVKTLTSKPVVGVGRYTSPEAMVSAIRRGVVDLIGAARPSIADPFLPTKIREGRVEDIRECIGCNICTTGDIIGVPIRCTQNPAMGEEYRRGWHPERIPPRKTDQSVLVVGGGPAGLECARALGQRGYQVVLTEARREMGGRVVREADLPGLQEWRRVVDWRLTQIEKMPNVELFPGSLMSRQDVLDSDLQHVIVATGASWRKDGIGSSRLTPVPGHGLESVFSPDDLMEGRYPSGRVLVYDDDHYYMASVLAERLIEQGCQVTFVTPAPSIADWSANTLEQPHILRRLRSLGANLHTHTLVEKIETGRLQLSSSLKQDPEWMHVDGVVLVANRISQDGLYRELQVDLAEGRLKSLRRIGDADAPHLIAQAVYSGHLAAREFEELIDGSVPFKREKVQV